MKLSKVKAELIGRRHLPIPDGGRWLASVLRGHCNYDARAENSVVINALPPPDHRLVGDGAAAPQPAHPTHPEMDEPPRRAMG